MVLFHAEPRKRRRRTLNSGNTLRTLLGFKPDDDYIEAERGWSDPDDDDEPLSKLARPPEQGHLKTTGSRYGESSSEEEEYVLTLRTERPTVNRIQAVHPSKPETNTSDSESASEEDAEYSMTMSESYRNSSSLSILLATAQAKAPSPPSSSDQEEPVLALPPPKQQQSMARSRQTLIQAGGKDQRPAFAASPEQARVGPLQLGNGYAVPATVNRFLREYQREGVRFFFRSFCEKRGALLGDDMGLGKTIQVIAFLSAIMGKTGYESDAERRIEAVRSGRQGSGYQKADAIWPTCLIICPSSVIDNWRNELETWGYFEHAAFTGARGRSAIDSFRRGRLDILITSHETASLNIDQLNNLDFTCIFIDEAHKLKNPGSQMTRAMNTFSCRARFALTGTAIQNSYRELYTLADWTNPGLLGSVKEWQAEIEVPLKRGQRRDASEEQLADARTRAEKLVRNVLPLFFLRRTKALISDQLPRKTDKVVFCPLTPTQLKVYERILSESEVNFMRRHADPCDCGRFDPETDLPYRRQNCCYKRDSDGHAWNRNMLKYIYLLQKCSNHVALVFPDPEDASSREPDRVERYSRQLSYVQLMFPDSWRDKRCNAANGMNEDLCGKWKVLSGLLNQWRMDGDKVLLFSTNLRLLQCIEFFISRQGYNFCRLDGSTPQHRRQALVDSFNRDTNVFIFLISTTAGGTGLNLTAANRVVVFDPHWNPSHDLQAMDRAYRFGQTRDVDVYRLIGAGSLEECVYGRQVYKQQQMQIGYNATKERRYFEGVAGDQENLGELFGCRNLFRLPDAQVASATKAIIDECNIAEVKVALEMYFESESLASDETLVEAANGQPVVSQTTYPVPLPKAKSADPVAVILDGAGVQYTHLNEDLTGGSRLEARISRAAQQSAASTSSRRPSKVKAEKKATPNVWPPPRPKAVYEYDTANS